MKKIEKYEVRCPECGSTNYWSDKDRGEAGCSDCGIVFNDELTQLIIGMDYGPEWRAFTEAEKVRRSRVGAPTSYSIHDKGLSTAISRVDRDGYGKKLPPSTRYQMVKLRKWQIRSKFHSSVDRNLAQAMAELDRLSNKVYAPKPIKEKAAVIYRKLLSKGLIRGRSIAAIAAAALYAAFRETRTPRTLNEISEASLVDKKDVARCYRFLLRKLDVQIPVTDPLTYISKIAEMTEISGKTQGLAIQILREAKRRRATAGKDPMGLAAAALYIACLQNGEENYDKWGNVKKITQKDIANAAGVTEVTVRNRYKTLKRELELELPNQE